MQSGPQGDDAGYSPSISMELELHGKRFAVSAMAPDFVIIRTSDSAPPGVGTVTMYLDGVPSTFAVEMIDGIAPERKRHVCRTPVAASTGTLVA